MKLSDIANITMGQSPSSEDVYSEVVGIPLLNGPTEFTDFSPIPKQYTNNGKKFAKNGDILFCVRGSTAGRMNFADQKFAIGRGIASIRGINGYPTEFIRVILENKLENILKSSTGSTFPNISRSQLLNLNIENINSNNANKIGLFYKYIYTKMELNTQTNQTLEQIAQAIFKHWFIDFAPVYAKANALARGETIEQAELAAMACLSGKTVEKITALKTQDPTAYHQLQQTAAAFPSEFVETEMGKVPRGWEVKPINEICRVVYGKGLPKNQLRASGYPVYGANGVIGYYDQYLYENRQVLVGCRGTVGQVYVSQPYSYITSNSLVIEYEKTTINLYFLELYLKSLDLSIFASGSVQPQITIQNLSKLKILIPNKEILDSFATLVDPIYQLTYKNDDEK
ncbi:restriction endonuclease subunit S, partial [Avibacterium avium]|uniref:restriction endonuclease subunit S n=2 Tax=Avibacterium avium TaxID=751 RepID=UPI003BF81320